ncbi:hypothetical protein B0A50_03682 [Salinomyces thailandicus]|uniref:Phospholipase D/nuclease n=1 Tax=Salinomyces thailandicus TaxID=706561 RepID=A0A4U0U3R8_9PEZI|nr:hypothetical protein B0A50_03682 [Salinomyces thailandica]
MNNMSNEDEDLKQAIALSLTSNATAEAVTAVPIAGNPSDIPSKATLGLAGFDRRAMEQERLARQAARGIKRESSISPPATRRSRKSPKIEETGVDLPSGARLNYLSTLVDDQQEDRKPAAANNATNRHRSTPKIAAPVNDTKRGPMTTATSVPQGGLVYPDGMVKKTWAFGHDRSSNEVKLEEVLEPRTLRTAVLSAFQWDLDWVLKKLKTPRDGGSTKCIFIMQAKEPGERQRMKEAVEPAQSYLRLCFPPMEGQTWCMHSKLMLLFHPEKLRIAIPTANLLNFDWGETGSMENSVFMIDLPRLADEKKTSVDKLTSFGRELAYFLEKQTVDQDVREGLLNFDFGATESMAFVHSVGGISYRDEAKRTGFLGLSSAVQHLGLHAEDVEIDFAASSIGSLNDDQLRNLHSAAKGEDVIARTANAQTKTKANFFKKSEKTATGKASNVRDRVRIYFPTHETVTSSKAGAAGTICLSRKYYENIGFPRSCFRDYISTREGLLSHNKILYARGKRREGRAVKDVAWTKEKAWKMNCRNWECGVLLPVPEAKLKEVKKEREAVVKKEVVDGEDSETESEDGTGEDSETESEGGEAGTTAAEGLGELVGMEVFEGLVDPPFLHPAPDYGESEPWYFLECNR